MTLMEIMMSVMILGLGLLGILSVIPFIEFHSARVVESDYVAATGTNAFAVIQSNRWEDPINWEQNQHPETINNNYIFPRFFDIFGERGFNEQGQPNGSIGLNLENGEIIQHVYPIGDRSLDICRGQDDLVVERDENSAARPQLLLTKPKDSDKPTPEFTGAYSWAALMSPVVSDPAQSYDNISFLEDDPVADLAMKVDVLVFRGRDAADNYDCITAVLAAVEGTGYLGGMISVTTLAPTEFEKSLGSSTHILLIGPSDSGPAAPFFSAWYKISNYSRDGKDFDLTLSGPSLPACWIEGAAYDRSDDVRVVLFRNLRGVFTRTIPISETE